MDDMPDLGQVVIPEEKEEGDEDKGDKQHGERSKHRRQQLISLQVLEV